MSAKQNAKTIEPADRLVSREEAAKTILGISVRALDRYLKRGDISFIPMGRAIRIRTSELDRFCEARETRLGR